MNHFESIKNPQQINLLIAFADMTNYAKNTTNMTALECFNFIAKFKEITGEIIESNYGKVVKFIGDAALIIFPEKEIDKGVNTLRLYKEKVDSWLKDKGFVSQLIIKAHFGEVAAGSSGIKENKLFDIIGENVNITARIKSNGLTITPQVFRKLNSETRKLFKKHTPPITYIDIREKHKD